VSPDNCVERPLGRELVRRSDKGPSCEHRDLGRHIHAEALGRVQSGTNSGAAERQFEQPSAAVLDLRDTGVDLGRPPGPLLTHREGHGVLEVGATDLDDAHPPVRLSLQFGGERFDRRYKTFVDLSDRGDVHRGREAVVARLAQVDVVVGADGRLTAQLTTSSWMARLDRTSLTFMLLCVPEPVCQT
jgi:hypothetical protein